MFDSVVNQGHNYVRPSGLDRAHLYRLSEPGGLVGRNCMSRSRNLLLYSKEQLSDDDVNEVGGLCLRLEMLVRVASYVETTGLTGGQAAMSVIAVM
jgi:hypothetical protein